MSEKISNEDLRAAEQQAEVIVPKSRRDAFEVGLIYGAAAGFVAMVTARVIGHVTEAISVIQTGTIAALGGFLVGYWPIKSASTSYQFQLHFLQHLTSAHAERHQFLRQRLRIA